MKIRRDAAIDSYIILWIVSESARFEAILLNNDDDLGKFMRNKHHFTLNSFLYFLLEWIYIQFQFRKLYVLHKIKNERIILIQFEHKKWIEEHKIKSYKNVCYKKATENAVLILRPRPWGLFLKYHSLTNTVELNHLTVYFNRKKNNKTIRKKCNIKHATVSIPRCMLPTLVTLLRNHKQNCCKKRTLSRSGSQCRSSILARLLATLNCYWTVCNAGVKLDSQLYVMIFSLEHLFTSIMAFMEFKSRWAFVACAEFVISVIVAVNAFDMKFTNQRTIFTNKMLCALENPDLVLHKVRYKQECLLLCQGDSRCANVNWKAPSTCEMYFYYAGVFGKVKDCVYFGQGEKPNFHEERSTYTFITGCKLKHDYQWYKRITAIVVFF